MLNPRRVSGATTVSVRSRYFLLVVAAIACAASIAWPWGMGEGATVWWLQVLGLAALPWALRRCSTPTQAAVMGLFYSTIWLSATFWWLFVAMHTYGGLPALLAIAAIVALAAALGLYYAFASVLYWRSLSGPVWLSTIVFAALWTIAEMARGIWLTGFGWGAGGYSHLTGPLAAYVPWLGSYGVGALAAWLAAWVGSPHRLRRTQWIPTAAILLLPLVVPATWNTWTQPQGTLAVTLLQGNIPQDEKFETGSGVPLALKWYGAKLQSGQTDLIVAPETAIPLLPDQLPESYWLDLSNRLNKGSTAALVGIPLGSFADGYTNSVLGFGPGQARPWQYDKHHLVPFGEFIPPWFKWFTQMMNIPLGDFNRGDLGQAPFEVKGQRVGANICYEDLYGDELGVRFADPDKAPTIFANVSNIGWFGDSIAIDQHLNISRMRAMEFERPFVRATNTGATVIIDHQGRVTASLPRLTRGVLEGRVEGRSGLTPFAWWVSRWGLWPLWLLCFSIAGWGLYRTRQRR